MYFGANTLEDPELLWLAAQSVEFSKRNRLPVFAHPGAEQKPKPLLAAKPRFGSCIVYSQVGLSSKSDVMAADKAILRTDWISDSLYTLINLRFNGWHQYKATGSIIALYVGNQPKVQEFIPDANLSLLPKGRAEVRDKRIWRESLNGIAVEGAGLSKWLFKWSGIGSVWSQNPPRLAEIRNFMTSENLDQLEIIVSGWNGWEWRRLVAVHRRPKKIVVEDTVEGPSSKRALLSWNLWNQPRCSSCHLKRIATCYVLVSLSL